MANAQKVEVLLVSGVSGAGLTTLAGVVEEHGYHVVEGVPSPLIPATMSLFKKEIAQYAKVALFVDLPNLRDAAQAVRADEGVASSVWGLDCSFEALMSRYRLTRHTHPLQPRGYSLEKALLEDAALMAALRPIFDVCLDTSDLTEKALRLKASALLEKREHSLGLFIMSFGYKYGVPRDAEVVIDARGLANPYWVKELSALNGLDAAVKDYIAKDPETAPFLAALYAFLDRYLLLAEKEARGFVFLDVGCSGGQHRSVYIAEALKAHYEGTYDVKVMHRELGRQGEDYHG